MGGPIIHLAESRSDIKEKRVSNLQRSGIGTVTPVEDSVKAIELLQKDIPELLIINLELPPHGGLEVLRVAKRLNPQLPVIVIVNETTINKTEEIVFKAWQEGGSILTEPLDPTVFHELVKIALTTKRKLYLAGDLPLELPFREQLHEEPSSERPSDLEAYDVSKSDLTTLEKALRKEVLTAKEKDPSLEKYQNELNELLDLLAKASAWGKVKVSREIKRVSENIKKLKEAKSYQGVEK